MRLALRIFGYGLDITFGELEDDEDEEPEDDYRGDCVTFPIGFTRPDIPWDHDCPVHSFEPADSDEDT